MRVKFFVQSHAGAGGVQPLPMDGTAYYFSACPELVEGLGREVKAK